MLFHFISVHFMSFHVMSCACEKRWLGFGGRVYNFHNFIMSLFVLFLGYHFGLCNQVSDWLISFHTHATILSYLLTTSQVISVPSYPVCSKGLFLCCKCQAFCFLLQITFPSLSPCLHTYNFFYFSYKFAVKLLLFQFHASFFLFSFLSCRYSSFSFWLNLHTL